MTLDPAAIGPIVSMDRPMVAFMEQKDAPKHAQNHNLALTVSRSDGRSQRLFDVIDSLQKSDVLFVVSQQLAARCDKFVDSLWRQLKSSLYRIQLFELFRLPDIFE